MLPYFQPVAGLLNDHALYAVGGVVRNHVRGVSSATEADFTTPSPPEAVIQTAQALGLPYSTAGLAWGSIVVNGADITSFRREEYWPDSRYPKVVFTPHLVEDAKRRDFTANAIYLAPDGRMTDPFSGAQHLRDGAMVWIGDPTVRLAEDPLRWWRWLRFCAETEGFASLELPQYVLDGTLHPIPLATLAQSTLQAAPKVSASRLAKERAKFAMQPHANRVRGLLRAALASVGGEVHKLIP